MLTKVAYRFTLFVILTLLTSFPAYALHVELHPKEVAPGDVFILKVQSGQDSSSTGGFPEAEFLGTKIDFYHVAEDYFMTLVPVDIDTLPREYPVTVTFGSDTKIIRIKIKPYTFLTTKITLPEEKVILRPEDLKRAEREAEMLGNVISHYTVKAWDGRFMTPTDTPVSEVFGVKRIMNNKKTSTHRGMDYKGDVGTPVRAVNSGTVVLRHALFFGGNTLVIDHGMGLFSIYMHLSEFLTSQGEKVSKGMPIGLVGMSGRATGPHLHLSIKLREITVNPLSLFELAL